MVRQRSNKKRTLSGEETAVSFVCRLSAVEVWSHALVGAEVAVMLVAVTVFGTGRLNAVRASQHLLTGDTGRDNQGVAPVLEVRNRLRDLLRLGLLHSVRPELEIDLDDIGSPVLRLLPALLHRVGAGELVAEPRSQ